MPLNFRYLEPDPQLGERRGARGKYVAIRKCMVGLLLAPNSGQSAISNRFSITQPSIVTVQQKYNPCTCVSDSLMTYGAL
jgi:hypothetical protein